MTAISSDCDALLRAILEAPRDDAPRLVMADWLQEHAREVECERCEGGTLSVWEEHSHQFCPKCSCSGRVSNGLAERAEFIRVGVELARTPDHEYGMITYEDSVYGGTVTQSNVKYADRRLELEARSRGLLDTHGERWTMDDLKKPCGYRNDDSFEVRLDRESGPSWVEYSRGYISAITLSADDFERHAEAIFRRVPVERVTLSDKRPYWNGGGYCWYDHERGNHSQSVPATANIPRDLFNGLSRVKYQLNRWESFASEPVAHAALSAALVKVGRQRTGLPIQK